MSGREARLPLQAWIALFVAAVTLPLCGLLWWNAAASARAAEETARRQVAALASQLAAETATFVDDTRAALQRMATRPDVTALDPARCGPLFAGFRDLSPRYANLVLADAAGRGVCASAERPPGAGAHAPLPWFRDVLAGRDFALGPPAIGPGSGRWTVAAAVPVRREARGDVAGALAVRIDLYDFPVPLLRAPGIADGAVLGIVDADGTVVARSRERERIGGPALPVTRALQTDRGLRSATARGADGVVHFASASPVPGTTWDAIAVYPADAAAKGVREAFRHTLALGVAVLASVWIAAALAARRLLRPVRAIAAAAEAVGAGRQRVRVAPEGPREIARIGERFNQMLERRERDETALRDSEARYRALFETSSDAIVGIDRDDRVVFANPALETLSGWRPAELVGRDLAVLQPDDLRAAHRQGMQRVVAAGGQVRIGSNETRLLHRDGHVLPVEIRYARVGLGSDDLYVGFLRDTSEREAALARLRESEERFRTMADSSPVLIWTADADGRPTYFNATWLAFTGTSPAEAIARGWLHGIHPDDAAEVERRWRDGHARRFGGSIEYRRLRHDGSYRWLLDARAPRFANDGSFVGFVGSAVDIHARVLAEDRIRRLTALYSALSQVNEAIARGGELAALLQSVCDVIVRETGLSTAVIARVDAAAGLLRTVAAAGEFAGAFRSHVAPLAPAPGVPEGSGALALRSGKPVVSNRRDEDGRVRAIVHDEVRSAIRSTAVFPLREAGTPAGVLAVYARQPDYFDDELAGLLELLADDVSFALESHAERVLRNEAEDGLRRLNATLEARVAERTRSLEAANRELEAFAYSVSHDLRAPLRSIVGFAELLHEGHADRLDAEGRAFLDRVKAAARRMARLIDDLLSLSRIARQSLERTEVDLTRLATEVADELAAAHPERSVDVTIAPGLRADADPGLARIVLDNLLGNAWKFTARTPTARIAVSGTADGGVVVEDNGAGFDPRYVDKLYAPFQRLHSERDYPGTGIGLAIVQRIVLRHGGAIHADARPGEGARFTFTFARPRSGPAAR